MEPRLLFLILFCLIIGLLHVIAFWRRKAGETAYAAARNTRREYEREYYCRMAVMAGHKEACRMYCIMHSDFFEDQHPLKPYKFKGMNVTFSVIIIRRDSGSCWILNSEDSVKNSTASRTEK